MVNKFQAQICILGIQMVWTRDAENALGSCRVDKKIMGDTNTKFLDMLNLLISQTTKNLEKMERKKYETLITVHMHQRDVFEAIVKTNVKHTLDFEWLKQARLMEDIFETTFTSMYLQVLLQSGLGEDGDCYHGCEL